MFLAGKYSHSIPNAPLKVNLESKVTQILFGGKTNFRFLCKYSNRNYN